jgi:NDP-sugar pyrophosphorylase family protein
MPVAGVPLIRRIVSWLATNGVTDVVLNLHHLPQTIAAVVGDGSDLGARVKYSWEQPVVLGAAGGPRQALPLLGVDTFLLINGDTLTDVDLSPLELMHKSTGALVTMVLVPNRAPNHYGGVLLDRDRRVVGFTPRGTDKTSYHFVGIQMVEHQVFASLPAGQPAQSVGGVYDALIATQPGAIRGFVTETAFLDIGTVADYWSASWSLIDADSAKTSAIGSRSHIDPSARVMRSILWDDVEVSKDCVIEECIVTDRVTIPSGTHLRRTILGIAADGSSKAWPLTL